MVKRILAATAATLPGLFPSVSTAQQEKEAPTNLDSRALPYAHAHDSFSDHDMNIRVLAGRGSDDWETELMEIAGKAGYPKLPSIAGRGRTEEAGYDQITTVTNFFGVPYNIDSGGERKAKNLGFSMVYDSKVGRFRVAYNAGKKELSDYLNRHQDTSNPTLITNENTLEEEAKSSSAFASWANESWAFTAGYLKNYRERNSNSPLRIDMGPMGIHTAEDSFREELDSKGLLLSGDHYLVPKKLSTGLDVIVLDRENDIKSRKYNIYTMNVDELGEEEGKTHVLARGRSSWIPEGQFALAGSIGANTKNREGDATLMADITPTLNIAGDFGFGSLVGIDPEGKPHYVPVIYWGDREKVQKFTRFVADQTEFLRDDASRAFALNERTRGSEFAAILGAHIYKTNQENRDMSNPQKDIQKIRAFAGVDAEYFWITGTGELRSSGKPGHKLSVESGLDIAKILGLENWTMGIFAGAERENQEGFEGSSFELKEVDRITLFGGAVVGKSF